MLFVDIFQIFDLNHQQGFVNTNPQTMTLKFNRFRLDLYSIKIRSVGGELMGSIIAAYIFMVYIPRLTFKSGINPSQMAWFPTDGKYSATQKLMLTRTRIFGDKISGTMSSGLKVWRQTAWGRMMYLENRLFQPYDMKVALPNWKASEMGQPERFGYKFVREQCKIRKEIKNANKEAAKKTKK